MHNQLDPELEQPLKNVFASLDDNPFDVVTNITLAREQWRIMVEATNKALPPIDGVDTKELWVAGPDGASDVKLKIYRPAASTGSLPAVYWIRGGGLVMGLIEQDDRASSQLALDVNCTVVSVEYRWAPEYPFPAPVEDCYAGLKWLSQHGEEVGVDSSRIAIAGESGGGGVCGSLAFFIRDRNEIDIIHQMLICPQIDDRDALPDKSAEQWFVTYQPASNQFGWESFIGQEPGLDKVPLNSVAARASDLSGLPPTSIFVSDLDIFVKGSMAYAHRLIDADIPTEIHVYPRAYHGFQLFAPEASISKRYFSDRIYTLKRAFEN